MKRMIMDAEVWAQATPEMWAWAIGAGLVCVVGWLVWDRRDLFAPIIEQIAHRYIDVRLPSYDELDEAESDDGDVVAGPVSPRNNNGATSNNVIATLQNERNALLRDGKVAALARLVATKKVTQTEGIELVFGVKASGSNATYREIRDALKAELERLEQPSYPSLAEKERRVREWIEE